MAIKKGAVIAGVVGTAATPVVGYFIHSHLKGDVQTSRIPPAIASVDAKVLALKRDEGASFGLKESCAKDKFSLDEIKGKINNSTETKNDLDKSSLAAHSSGTIEGCLSADLKWRNKTDKQHAILGNIEMALTKESHGLFISTLVTNLFNEDSLQHINKVFRLTKESSGKWKVDHGYLWTDKSFKTLTTSATQGASNLIFGGLISGQINYFDLCTRGTIAKGSGDQACEEIGGQGKTFEESTKKKMKWTQDDTNGKGVFEHLTIKAGEKDKEQLGDLWGNKSEDLFKNELGGSGLSLHLYEENKGFYKIGFGDGDDKTRPRTNLSKWFEPFKDAKGSWK